MGEVERNYMLLREQLLLFIQNIFSEEEKLFVNGEGKTVCMNQFDGKIGFEVSGEKGNLE